MKEITPEKIYSSAESVFYKDLFNNTNYFSPPKTFDDFPRISWREIITTPFLERLYKKKRLLIKIVGEEDSSGLIGRTVEDIAQEDYGLECERPLVLFNSLGESLEKSMWFYTRNVIPLINDSDIDITAMTAAKYKIDSIVTDNDSLLKFLPKLSELYDVSNVHQVRIIDSRFNFSAIEKLVPNAHIFYTLALPEVGSIATSSYEEEHIFVEHPTTNILAREENVVVTRNILLPTPIIQYNTGLRKIDYTWA